mgnify:CR=1 FL=1
MTIEDNLKKYGITIPNPPSPVGNYVAYNRSGNQIFISGQLPINEKGEMIKGKIGKDLKIEDGMEAAKLCILNSIGHLKKAVGNLENVKKCIKITGYINCSEDFYDHPKLLNSASDILVNIFGKKGSHSRAVVGVPSLPLNAAVEIVTIYEV